MIAHLPDGKSLELPAGATARDLAQKIGPGLAKAAVGALANGELYDLMKPLPDGAEVKILTAKDPEFPRFFRHTLAHVMAQAVREYFVAQGFAADSVKFGVGPVIENGFYYDIDAPAPISDEILPQIEERMRQIIARDLSLSREVVSKEKALQAFSYDPYKTELIQDLPPEEPISFYAQENFTDLCRGPHVPSTGKIPPHFKLTHVAGAYWRGDEKRPMLQRIYGVAFTTKEELEHYLWQQEEAKKRDHRKLGRELELFVIDPLVGKGLVLWLPKGNILREELSKFIREEQENSGYQFVTTPHIGSLELYKTSGHYPYYAADQFPPMELEGESYLLKPMNCPHHIRIYAARPRSYRELPLRLAEFGTVYRFEQSGELSGLTRVRGFTQDDAHLFCTPEQVKGEFGRVIELIVKVLSTLSLTDFRARIGTRSPEKSKYVGPEAYWEAAERQIEEVCQESGISYTVEPGDAAFYGPKLDFLVKDALGREWQLGTSQLDYNLPERFNLSYITPEGNEARPVMIHRALLGSMERFIGPLIEHFAGDFPLWLAPVQAVIIPISERSHEYGLEVFDLLKAQKIRAELDLRPERMQAKIRDAELAKVPLILVAGEREAQNRTLAVRERHGKERGSLSLDEVLGEILVRIQGRSLE